MSFGSRLYDLRIGKGMSQSEVGKAIGLSGSAIGNYEKGTREPTIDALKALSSLFNVDMDYLLDKKAVAAESNVDPQLTQKFTIIKNIMISPMLSLITDSPHSSDIITYLFSS